MSGREVTAHTTLARDQAACTPADLDAVRYEAARADVLADVAKQAFDLTNWRGRRRTDRPREPPRLSGVRGGGGPACGR